ncbi:MAG: YjjG family noncanonical pyrimidine nucleotidase [Candidatus Limimorpha sp.]
MYKNIFFDLDNTLWDFDASSEVTFEMIFTHFNLNDNNILSAKDFHDVYVKYNDRLWEQYRKGLVGKDFLKSERFRLPLNDFGIFDDKLAKEMGEFYTFWSPRNVALVPNAIEILDYLAPNHGIHIITNGFAEVQNIKIKESGLEKYIDTMTVSEEIGIKKPDTRIFEYAIKKAHGFCGTPTYINNRENIMVGDDLYVDITPAREIGIDQCFFNRKRLRHKETVTYEITDLIKLKEIL